MFIQITEPEEVKEKIAIGIDFGTTHSVVGIKRSDKVELIPLDGSSWLLPSVVFMDKTETLVGAAAKKQETAVYAVKRSLSKTDLPEISSPLCVAVEIFKHIQKKIDDFLNSSRYRNVVVTVPAYFDEVARSHIKISAEMAGFKVLRLISEPTAAALAYGLDHNKEGSYIIYDFGGGTFDVSVLKIKNGVFQVIATGGDAYLGGDDIDAAIAKILDPSAPKKRMSEAKEIKEGKNQRLSLESLNEIIDPFVKKTVEIVKETIRASEIDTFDGIVLVGGSSRLERVFKGLSEEFSVPIIKADNPDEVVAIGATYQAELLCSSNEIMLVDVTPLSLGIEIMGGMVDVLIPRNTPIPFQKTQLFSTFKDNQQTMKIHVVQGESDRLSECRSLGSFVLSGIRPNKAGEPKIKIQFALDENGLLKVSAFEQDGDASNSVEVIPSRGLSEEVIREMLVG